MGPTQAESRPRLAQALVSGGGLDPSPGQVGAFRSRIRANAGGAVRQSGPSGAATPGRMTVRLSDSGVS